MEKLLGDFRKCLGGGPKRPKGRSRTLNIMLHPPYHRVFPGICHLKMVNIPMFEFFSRLRAGNKSCYVLAFPIPFSERKSI
jgi:hypothetical protein